MALTASATRRGSSRSSVAGLPWATAQYAQARVVEALISALRDDSLAVNRAALDSLRILTGQDFGVDDAQWVAWRDGMTDSDAMFAARRDYAYPVFRRGRRW